VFAFININIKIYYINLQLYVILSLFFQRYFKQNQFSKRYLTHKARLDLKYLGQNKLKPLKRIEF